MTRNPVLLTLMVGLIYLAGSVPLTTTRSLIPGPIGPQAIAWHVPADFSTIQAALNAAASGDVILVAAGTYSESLDFGGKDIRLESISGPEHTAITGSGSIAVTIGPLGEIIGFTIANAQPSFGAGMVVGGDGSLIQRNVFENNDQGGGAFGSAIWGNSASPIIDSNFFRGNTCDTQHLSGVIAFVNGSSPVITNNIFHNNPCRAINFTLPQYTAPQVINNTFVSNRVGIYIDSRIPIADKVFRNNLIYQNEIGLRTEFGEASNTPTWEHNLVFGNATNYSGISDQTGANNNLSLNPQLHGAVTGDFRLRLNSPAIDAGSSSGCPLKDYRGFSRPYGAGCEIGAYEVVPEFLFSATNQTVSEAQGTANITVTLSVPLTATAAVAYSSLPATGPNAAQPGADYQPVSGTLVFSPSVQTQTFQLAIIDNDDAEADEVVRFGLSSPSSPVNIVAADNATLTIIDDDWSNVYFPIATHNYCADFSDDFNNPGSGWFTTDDAWRRVEYFGGEYRVLAKQSGFLFLFRAPTCTRENHQVEAAVRWAGPTGSDLGLIFGETDAFGRFYFFDINTDFQAYALFRFNADGTVTTLAPPTQSFAIYPGTTVNQLQVTRTGNQMALVANGVLLGYWFDSSLGGLTHVGLAAGPYDDQPLADARFDYFRVTGLPAEGNLHASSQSGTGPIENGEPSPWRPNLSLLPGEGQ